ncbi:uncharacterized protein NECHADRAFT_77476 [Fusarium vanettenii 77-13-4]|uniref:Uncharacterized protein n=1 Tax=Fusarium vanettenii (strain ATCC MYA-4622 / CBS 123669 / FGSC 9596 / NRRL 45880 / 77-13-4) TaxID=660122 RepID=C7YLC0_FUSV7|nr:uncharacterized protein NECHADRAFT_77476 [Fusarium vanettenii 77-13-4]EEU47233.1 predicted protein [Fusarium vanettenii 77-13-4]
MARTIRLIEPPGKHRPGTASASLTRRGSAQRPPQATPPQFSQSHGSPTNSLGGLYSKNLLGFPALLLALHPRSELKKNNTTTHFLKNNTLPKPFVYPSRRRRPHFLSGCLPKHLLRLLFKMSSSTRQVRGLNIHPDHNNQFFFRRANEGAVVLTYTIPRRHKSRRDLDDSIMKIITLLAQVRKEMTILASEGPLGTDALGDLVEEARLMVHGAVFVINRFYHDREEGLRTARQREYALLRQQGYGCILYRVHHALITIRRDFQFHYQQFIASRDSRISKLHDALHKVEVQKLALIAQGGTTPY